MTFLLGPRGVRPYTFAVPRDRLSQVCGIPGVEVRNQQVASPADAAWIVSQVLGVENPHTFSMDKITPPGLARFRALGLKEKARPYQLEGAAFLVRRSWGLLCDDMRLGKSFEALMASVLVDSRTTLILCPAQARPVWRDEVFNWLPDATVVTLHGRGANELRVWCSQCKGRGRAVQCGACPSKRGFTTLRDEKALAYLANLPRYTYLICNYDLLLPQREATSTGVMHTRESLPGWSPLLGGLTIDVGLCDESHLLRGFSTNAARRGLTRRERTRDALRAVPRVWLLTGTPVYGFVRDLWGQLDVASGGLFGKMPWDFYRRYCDYATNEYGWTANGAGPFEEELNGRLKHFLLKRTREQVNVQLPAKVRQLVRVEPEKGVKMPIALPRGEQLTIELSKTCKHKLEALTENVLGEMAEGGKCLVFCLLRKNAEMVYAAITAAMQSKDSSAKMKQVNAMSWTAHGEQTPETRAAYARSFREHQGAAVFVATIDSVQVALSLRGARSVHFADLHYSPSALLQAEDRPYEPGTNGLTVLYYVVAGSVDELVADIVLPKFKTVDSLFTSEQTRGAISALNDRDTKLTLDEIMAKLTAHLEEEPDEGETPNVRNW